MRNLKQWIGAALLAQPFYAEAIRMIGLVAQGWRFRMPAGKDPVQDRPESLRMARIGCLKAQSGSSRDIGGA